MELKTRMYWQCRPRPSNGYTGGLQVGDCFSPDPLDLVAVKSVLAHSNTDCQHLGPEGSLVLDSSVSPSPKDPLVTRVWESSYTTGGDSLL